MCLTLRKIRSVEEQIDILNKKLSIAKQQEDTLLREMDVTGQDVEDMQEQNIRLMQQLREKDEANFKLREEDYPLEYQPRLVSGGGHGVILGGDSVPWRGGSRPAEADMKRSNSPGWLGNSLPRRSQGEEEGEEGEKETVAGHRAKRERRQGRSSTTLCKVCNIQLNSCAQAQIHYKGKTHQRRLRHLTRAASTGTQSRVQAHPLLASLPLPGRPLQPQTHPQLELKHFLPLRINGSSPFNLFPNFNTMDPVQKAVINHTFGMAPPKKKPIISCNICHLRFNSTNQAEAHYKGHKHARKLKALGTQRNSHRNRQRTGQSPSTSGSNREGGERETKRTGGGGRPLTDAHPTDVTGQSSSPQPAPLQAEHNHKSLLAATPPSQPSPFDSSSLLSPEPSPQVLPDSHLSEQTSDCAPKEGCGPEPSPAPQSDPQGNSTGGEEEGKEVQGAKEAKKSNTKQHLHCPVCKVTVNSSSQLKAHCSGSRHKQMLDGQSCSQPQRRIKVTPPPRLACRNKQRMGSKSRAGVGLSSQPFHCELCQLSVNSETQLKQHLNSRRHKERLAGRPIKPKFSPYSKIQPSTILATKLALQKQLSKALPAGFLASPFNPATLCTMAAGPLALRPSPGPASILQGPLISPTLFRPAPGPLKATHTHVIFSPY
ncbi:zinc finger protein 385C-like [Lampris incognitus]|uniref:zinc finger protein 385C-like n=1 Tax=Lampris incognitus TaxID=2546036 RepID=UPI0024B509B9|nr:zinc finger protein 385C-like [Lampris incognitus]